MAKPRSGRDYKRPRCARQSSDTFLIVTEGTVTEPEYFKALKSALNMSAADVKVCPSEYGTDPINVVKFAAEMVRVQQNLAKKSAFEVPYDQVWVVFDQEGPKNGRNWRGGLDSARGRRFSVVFSTPSFEFWLLLHHRYTTATFVNSDAVEARLKSEDNGYSKKAGQTDFTGVYLPKTEDAIIHARRVREDHARTGANNPHTDTDELVIRLHLAVREHNWICAIKKEWMP